MDKKQYQTVIEACTSLALVATIQNKLNKVYVATEDTKLKQLLKPAIDELKKLYLSSIVGGTASGIASNMALLDPTEETYKSLIDYCTQRIESAIPQ